MFCGMVDDAPLAPHELERIRRSLAMSPSLPGPQGALLLQEVRRLRERLKSVDDDLALVEEIVRRAREQIDP